MSNDNHYIPAIGEIPVRTQVSHEHERPGLTSEMPFKPIIDALPDEFSKSWNDKNMPPLKAYKGSGKLQNCVALITGGDSGIGAAVALFFAREGCDIALTYVPAEEVDAKEIQGRIEEEGRKCFIIATDLRIPENCRETIDSVVQQYGKIDILVNNAAEQHLVERLEDLDEDVVRSTFETNILSFIFLCKYAVPHIPRGGKIINTTSVVAYRGSASILDYSSTKGAIVSFTRSLAKQLMTRGIRVNAVAPSSTLTPLQPISRDQENLEGWVDDSSSAMGRVAQPSEIAPAFVFLASSDSCQFNGQVLHPSMWEIYNT